MGVERVFVDTNILFSGLGFRGNQARLLALALEGRIRLVLAEAVLKEIRVTLADKLPNHIPALENLLRSIHYETIPTPEPDKVAEAATIVRDPKDAAILASILAAAPDAAVTGDRDLLTEEIRAIVPTCTCAEYLDRLSPDTED